MRSRATAVLACLVLATSSASAGCVTVQARAYERLEILTEEEVSGMRWPEFYVDGFHYATIRQTATSVASLPPLVFFDVVVGAAVLPFIPLLLANIGRAEELGPAGPFVSVFGVLVDSDEPRVIPIETRVDVVGDGNVRLGFEVIPFHDRLYEVYSIYHLPFPPTIENLEKVPVQGGFAWKTEKAVERGTVFHGAVLGPAGPAGRYVIELYLDERLQATETFEIVDGPSLIRHWDRWEERD